MKIVDWLIERLSEKTTWIGLTAALGAVGIALNPDLKEAIAVAGVAVAGVIAIITKENKPDA